MSVIPVEFNGLCAFVRDGAPRDEPTQVTALLVDGTKARKPMAQHDPFLVIPLSGVALKTDQDKPDTIIDYGEDDLLALWDLTDRKMQIGSGNLKSDVKRRNRVGPGPQPDHRDLSWIADLEVGAGVGKVAAACMSPSPPPIVTARIEFGQGRFEAITEGRWEFEQWRLVAKNRTQPKPEYEQTLAARVRFLATSNPSTGNREITLTSLRGSRPEANLNVEQGYKAIVSNLPRIPPTAMERGATEHFLAYYDVSEEGQHLDIEERPIPLRLATPSRAFELRPGVWITREAFSREIFCPSAILYL